MNGITEEGKGLKGSKFLFQHLVNDKQVSLNYEILSSSPSLMAFIKQKDSFQWKSPLKELAYKEFRNEFLELEESWAVNKDLLKEFWPAMGPQWDGIAIVEGKEGKKGLLLVEAKAHVKEMRSQIQAKGQSRLLIENTINEVKNYVHSSVPLDTWINQYYQLSNRLAFLYILNQKLKIPAWLVLTNFVNDQTHISTSLENWMSHYVEVFDHMGLNPSKCQLLTNVITIFPESK
ncbi:hypothetical protein RFW18_15765 [Metabacillus idriensis]|uniref:hypothetical protein n=1 Tax=Metabacillus idriensis TaxID=324768 RepID=UPI0028148C1A|nr:hypothetical protein [Metabacillus idriensis]MDR0139210.1 hypothetical protein [Metabacillus idriensis]